MMAHIIFHNEEARSVVGGKPAAAEERLNDMRLASFEGQKLTPLGPRDIIEYDSVNKWSIQSVPLEIYQG